MQMIRHRLSTTQIYSVRYMRAPQTRIKKPQRKEKEEKADLGYRGRGQVTETSHVTPGGSRD